MSSGDTSLTELGIRLVGSLALVVGLMLLIARAVNKRVKAPAGATIQVVHRQALGRGTGVAVVSVGTRVLVVGTTEHQITLLTEVEPDEVGLDLDPDLDAELDVDSATGPETRRRKAWARPAPLGQQSGPLAGSVLSKATWKQTLAAFTGQAADEPRASADQPADSADPDGTPETEAGATTSEAGAEDTAAAKPRPARTRTTSRPAAKSSVPAKSSPPAKSSTPAKPAIPAKPAVPAKSRTTAKSAPPAKTAAAKPKPKPPAKPRTPAKSRTAAPAAAPAETTLVAPPEPVS